MLRKKPLKQREGPANDREEKPRSKGFTPKPGKCKHCKGRLERVGDTLHMDCVEPWWEANKDNLMAKVARSRAKEQKLNVKRERAIDRKRKEALKRPAEWASECRSIVQKIARIRDHKDGCISCDLPATWGGQWHGSHFRSHGACSALELHLWNIHKSCSACNLHKSGNIIEYRPRLIDKIGQERFDWLMSQNQVIRRDVDYYKRFKRVMGKRLRRMEKSL